MPSRLQPIADLMLNILRDPRKYPDFSPENGYSAYSNPDGIFVYNNQLFIVESKTSPARHAVKQFTKMCCNTHWLLEDLQAGGYDLTILPHDISIEEIRELQYLSHSPAYNRLVMPYSQKNIKYAMGFHKGVRDNIPLPGDSSRYVSMTVPWSIDIIFPEDSDFIMPAGSIYCGLERRILAPSDGIERIYDFAPMASILYQP